ncbi:MAG: dTMP kinase [Planctomycetota bacterium]
MYLAFDGPDGGGKSTQVERLVAMLRATGREVAAVREPGSTPVGEALRQLLLDPATGEMSPLAEGLLFFAARAEMVRTEVAPALAAGAIVVADRCYLSTKVYQGVAATHGLGADLAAALTEAAHGAARPDGIFVLDVSYEVGVQRRHGGVADRIEQRGRDYHERVRRGYLELARRDPIVSVINAEADADIVHQEIAARVLALLGEHR